MSADLEERLRGAQGQRSVHDFRLSGQVADGVDGSDQAFDGEEGGQVGGVGRDDDQREQRPHAAHQTGGHRPETNRKT